MKFAIALIAAVLSAQAVAATHSENVEATPEQRCAYLAEYASDVAIVRDLGVSKADVIDIAKEQYRNVILDAHIKVIGMTYGNPQFTPEQMHDGLLEGCLYSVAQEHKKNR